MDSPGYFTGVRDDQLNPGTVLGQRKCYKYVCWSQKLFLLNRSFRHPGEAKKLPWMHQVPYCTSTAVVWVFSSFNSSLFTELAMQASVSDKLSGYWTPPCCPNDRPLQLTGSNEGLLDCTTCWWGLHVWGCKSERKCGQSKKEKER